MFCPECGTENPSDAKFCYECGINLSETINRAKKILDNSKVPVVGEVQSDSGDQAETTESENESERLNNDCIVCKAGKMIPTIHRGSLGFGTKNILQCNNCGAIFEKKGQKYKLSKFQTLIKQYGLNMATKHSQKMNGSGLVR